MVLMLLGILALLGLPFLLLGWLIEIAIEGGEQLMSWMREHKQSQLDAAEAELDRQQAELRATILHLAGQLGADAHEARKALIRESFLASSRLPNKPE